MNLCRTPEFMPFVVFVTNEEEMGSEKSDSRSMYEDYRYMRAIGGESTSKPIPNPSSLTNPNPTPYPFPCPITSTNITLAGIGFEPSLGGTFSTHPLRM